MSAKGARFVACTAELHRQAPAGANLGDVVVVLVVVERKGRKREKKTIARLTDDQKEGRGEEEREERTIARLTDREDTSLQHNNHAQHTRRLTPIKDASISRMLSPRG